MSIPLMLCESDLLLIGYSSSSNSTNVGKFRKDGTSFLLTRKTCNVEYLMLKSIMLGLGYEVSLGEKFARTEKDAKKNKFDMIVRTTYPWEKYMLLNEANDNLDKKEDSFT